MYLKLFDVTEQAINSLIAAQRRCEEIYMCSPEGSDVGVETAEIGDEE